MLMQSARPLGELENPHEFIPRHIGVAEADERHMLSVIGEASRRALVESIVRAPQACDVLLQRGAECVVIAYHLLQHVGDLIEFVEALENFLAALALVGHEFGEFIVNFTDTRAVENGSALRVGDCKENPAVHEPRFFRRTRNLRLSFAERCGRQIACIRTILDQKRLYRFSASQTETLIVRV